MQTPTYPEDSEEAGKSYWKTMHNVASLYPVRPSPRHKREFTRWFDYTIDHYVCKDPCTRNAKRYLRANPLDLSSRKTLSHDLCKMHNNVRQEKGQQTANCDLVLGDSALSPLANEGMNMVDDIYEGRDTDEENSYIEEESVPHIETHGGESESTSQASGNEDVEPDNGTKTNQFYYLADVSGALHKYKKASSRIFKELCREDKLPYPTIYHRPCPADPRTSCTSFPLDANGKIAGKAVVYLNPYNAGAKTIAHEFTHYLGKMRGNDGLAEDEQEVERRALKFIHEKYPHDHEDSTYTDRYYRQEIITPAGRRITGVQERIERRYPRYAMRARPAEPEPEPIREPGEEAGFLRHFDPAYSLIEKPFALSRESLNMAYTPEIISALTQTIVESNMSPIGSLLVSGILGLGIGTFVVFNKSSLVEGDRMLLSEISAHFVANTARYANKDAAVHVMDDAERLGQAVGNLNPGEIVNILTGRSMFGGYDDGTGKQHTPLGLDLLPPAPPRPIVRGQVAPAPMLDPLYYFGGAAEERGHQRRMMPPPPVQGRGPPPPQTQTQQSGIPMPFVRRTSVPPPSASRGMKEGFERRPQPPPGFRPTPREGLISGVDEQGFYHGPETEAYEGEELGYEGEEY